MCVCVLPVPPGDAEPMALDGGGGGAYELPSVDDLEVAAAAAAAALEVLAPSHGLGASSSDSDDDSDDSDDSSVGGWAPWVPWTGAVGGHRGCRGWAWWMSRVAGRAMCSHACVTTGDVLYRSRATRRRFRSIPSATAMPLPLCMPRLAMLRVVRRGLQPARGAGIAAASSTFSNPTPCYLFCFFFF